MRALESAYNRWFWLKAKPAAWLMQLTVSYASFIGRNRGNMRGSKRGARAKGSFPCSACHVMTFCGAARERRSEIRAPPTGRW